MLILDRLVGERIFIGQDVDAILAGRFIRVTLIRIKPDGSAALGIDATKDTVIVRESLLQDMSDKAGRSYLLTDEKPVESVCVCPVCGRGD